MKNDANITMVQLTYDPTAKDDVVDRMEPFFEQAAQKGSDLIVFPEYVLGNEIHANHPNIIRFRELAKKHSIYAVSGVVEMHGERRTTCALVVDRSGVVLGRYLKTHPAAGPPPHYWPPIENWDAEARGILGSQFKVFHLDFGTIGILQCYDGFFPEAWGCTSYAGAEVILWINGREGRVEDAYCISAAHAYGCIVGGNITNGANTGFAEPAPPQTFISAEGDREYMRLYPRIDESGDQCVHASVDMKKLRSHRKHLRTMHQRRPELYSLLTQDVTMWKDYPDIEWDVPESIKLVNKSQL